MPFPYFARLSAANKKIYRRSDAIREVRLPDRNALAPQLDALRAALESESQRAVGRASRELVRAITDMLGVEPLQVKVRRQRPRFTNGELHGLYTRPPVGTSTIELWMRTAAHERVVAFRTYLRTLLHEVCHHLDFTLFEMTETFHTEGFFRRESSLVRQLAGSPQKGAIDDGAAEREIDTGETATGTAKTRTRVRTGKQPKGKQDSPVQLQLDLGGGRER